jgi:tellurite resistance protein TehA-like permease
MARKDRLIEEVKLGGVLGAVSLGMFVAATGGTVGLAIRLYPALTDPVLWAGAVAILFALSAFGVVTGIIIFTLRKLERE